MALELIGNSATPGADIPIGILTADIAANTLVIPTAAVPLAPLQATGQFRARIGSELLLITGNQNTAGWTSQRGIEGTVAAIHKAGDTIYHDITRGALLSLVWGLGQMPAGVYRGRAIPLGTKSGAVGLDLATGDAFTVKTSGAITFATPTNVPAGVVSFLDLWVEGKEAIGFWGALKWIGTPVVPDLSSGTSLNVYNLVTLDGVAWYAMGEGGIPADVPRVTGTPTNLQALLYDTASKTYKPTSAVPVIVGSPVEGDALLYNEELGIWEPGGVGGLSKGGVDKEIATLAVQNLSGQGIALNSALAGGTIPYAEPPVSRNLGTTLSTAVEPPSLKTETPFPFPLWKGQSLQLVQVSPAKTQSFVLSADVAAGATVFPVVAQKPNANYAAGTTTVTPTTASVLAALDIDTHIGERAMRRAVLNTTVISGLTGKLRPGNFYLASKPNAALTLQSLAELIAESVAFFAEGELLGITNTSTGTQTVTGFINVDEAAGGATLTTITLQPGESFTFVADEGPKEYRVVGHYRPLDTWTAIATSGKSEQTPGGTSNALGAKLESGNTTTRLRGSLTTIGTVAKPGQAICTIPLGKRPPVETQIIARLAAGLTVTTSPVLTPPITYWTVPLNIATSGAVSTPTGFPELPNGTIISFDNVSFPIA
jgi:hypothetical protein